MVQAQPGIWLCSDSSGEFEMLSGGIPTCNPNLCNYSFPQGLGVISDCDGKGTGQECTASCTGAYDYEDGEGPQIFTCGKDSSFTGTNPKCVAKPCTVQADLANFKTDSCIGKVHSEQCAVECLRGYTGEPV